MTASPRETMATYAKLAKKTNGAMALLIKNVNGRKMMAPVWRYAPIIY